jgi:Uma2 family endonuclease
MAGGTVNHDTIKSNIQRILWNLLRGNNCRAYSSDMKVYIAEKRYFHSNVTVTCDPRDRGRVQAIQSPRLVVEVLSPTTELTDRTWKLKNYCPHPTIEEGEGAADPRETYSSFSRHFLQRASALAHIAFASQGVLRS